MKQLIVTLTFCLFINFSVCRVLVDTHVNGSHPTNVQTNSSQTINDVYPTPSQIYKHKTYLDPQRQYALFWSSNESHILFEAHVKTRGYVGFGISPNGRMYPADVVIGWVGSDGKAHLKDCHTVDHVSPTVDQSQDWKLIHGEENSFGTMLKFVRPLDTCDDDDIKITDDTMRLIYSYHTDDPTSMTSFPYHGATHRGSLSKLLLSGSTVPQGGLPSDTKTFDFVFNNYKVPAQDTTYMCKVFKLPAMSKKHHMIKFEPVITPGNEMIVHHIVITQCMDDINSTYEGVQYECDTQNNQPDALNSCYLMFIAWAIGGQEFYFPDHVGIPLGIPGDSTFYVMQMHYDNPTIRSDIVDSSGMRVYYSPKIRQYDAQFLSFGQSVNTRLFIPPFEKNLLSQGFSGETCLRKSLDQRPDGISVIAAFHHSHLLGRAMRTRIVRNGTEMEPISVDNHYDFNFQDFRLLRKERKIFAGDQIIVDCVYDSTGRTKPTLGGLGTHEEMCITALLVYPRIEVSASMSSPIYDNLASDPKEAVRILKTWNWTDPNVREKFQNILYNTSYSSGCAGRSLNPPYTRTVIPYGEPTVKYVPPPSRCKNEKVVATQNGHHEGHNSSVSPPVPAPTQQYRYQKQLDYDGNYIIHWDFNQSHITFEVNVRTHGYVGFGLSPNGKMYPADVVIGWVSDDGIAHLKDCHTVGHVPPVMDKSQDWTLLYGKEDNFGTTLKFVRKLDTCDINDTAITDNTMRLIYSYHHEDPATFSGFSFHPNGPVSLSSLPWHGASNRGTRSALLLSGPQSFQTSLPPDSKHFDFVGKQIHVPGKDTTYMCTGYQFPKLDRKHHMIKYVPIVQPENVKNVHHIVLHYCTGDIDPSLDGVTYECYNNTPAALKPCYSILLAWAVGGEAYQFPDNVGMPFGTPGDPTFFILETHYDNPTLKTDIVDSSGIRIIYTPTLRTHDAGTLTIGESSNKLQFIPPFEKDYLEQGFCSEECLRKGLKSKPNGINVFAVFHHMHLIGRKISTRIVRNGTELEPIAFDDSYDFDYQDIRVLSKERKILPGDRFILDCHYDSSMKTKPTFGGLSTREEMCYSFMMYYPKTGVELCVSHKIYDNIPRDINVLSSNPQQAYEGAVRTLMSWNWTDPAVRKRFDGIRRNTTYQQYCSGKTLTPEYSLTSFKYPDVQAKYVPPVNTNNCPVNQKNTNTSRIPPPTQTVSTSSQKQLSSLPREQFHNRVVLDRNGSYVLYWKTNLTHITFEVHVKTRGYVGLGLSPNGKMYPSDVVVGWIDNQGAIYFKDYHTVGHVPPVLDQSQDWVLLGGEENSNGTILRFTRKLDTCDSNDIKITDDTLRVIYAYHPNDPQSVGSLPWHGAGNRGTKSLMLLSGPKEVNNAMPTDIKTIEFLNNNYHVPGKDTTYHCTTWRLPDLGKKHHMIKYEPIITPGNELNVHHILVYHCAGNADRRFDGISFECYTHERPKLPDCFLVFIAWAIGGEAFYYPDNVGMSLGTSRDPSFFVMETHYDNPTMKTDIIDSSGIRISITPTLRKLDAGIMEIGQNVDKMQMIPPHEDQFVSTGYCSDTCIGQGLKSEPNGVKVFAVLQHAHLLGKELRTRLIRNGVEQKPLASDNNYDFDYQDFRMLREERTIMPNDQMIVDCIYNSTRRSGVTYGGLKTREEMCISFIMYYPRVDFEFCLSKPKFDNIAPTGKEAAHNLSTWNWSDAATRQQFRHALQNTTYRVTCGGKYMVPKYHMDMLPSSHFEPTQRYSEPHNNCPVV